MSDKNLALSAKNVTKNFKIYHDKPLTLKDRVLKNIKKSYSEFSAINDISVDIFEGEQVGLIGHNGCGKSTLLKLFTRILYPEIGTIEINGKVSSLLELGAGFHPDFSGRENIYTNATIFGLKKSEINEIISQIIDFSELVEFIDNPVRTYSSGMYMRLAFSVAIHVKPQILLIDEILAVGDASFQKKCLDKILEFKANGVTIIIVSHDLSTIERICDRVLWLDNGNLIKDGPPKSVINAYLEKLFKEDEHTIVNTVSSDDEIPTVVSNEDKRWGSLAIEITEVSLLDVNNTACSSFGCGEFAKIKLFLKFNKKVIDYGFGLGIFSTDGTHIYGTNTYIDRVPVPNTSHEVDINIPSLGLISGSYWIDIACHNYEGVPFDYQMKRLEFKINSTVNDVGNYRIPHNWEFH